MLASPLEFADNTHLSFQSRGYEEVSKAYKGKERAWLGLKEGV